MSRYLSSPVSPAATRSQWYLQEPNSARNVTDRVLPAAGLKFLMRPADGKNIGRIAFFSEMIGRPSLYRSMKDHPEDSEARSDGRYSIWPTNFMSLRQCTSKKQLDTVAGFAFGTFV